MINHRQVKFHINRKKCDVALLSAARNCQRITTYLVDGHLILQSVRTMEVGEKLRDVGHQHHEHTLASSFDHR